VLLIVALFLQSQKVADWWKLRDYKPSAAIAQLAHDTTMTDQAQHLFYINHPSVASKQSFAKSCPSGGEKTIVLGCYKGNQTGIYMLAVTDDRLHGVEQVTAAHEMLHAAYERLSKGDKEEVDSLLQNFYRHDLRDQRIKDILKTYEKSEPGQQLNEMHSIFGTEIAKLPGPLENYYKRYFSDRSKVARYANRYQAVFTTRQETIKKDDEQLAAWKKQISNNEATLKQQQSDLERMKSQMDSYKSSGKSAAYNALVPTYNIQIESFNQLLAQAKIFIERYNKLVEQRNSIAVEAQQLEKALSGSLSPIGQ
jgi:chromosome segregation ATPase